jgi:hypothetical protein
MNSNQLLLRLYTFQDLWGRDKTWQVADLRNWLGREHAVHQALNTLFSNGIVVRSKPEIYWEYRVVDWVMDDWYREDG